MTRYLHRVTAGPIAGLKLPVTAWNSLLSAGITTLDQLRDVSAHLEYLAGIGPRTADIIRAELSRAEGSQGSL